MTKAILLSMVVASISFFISHSQLLKKFRDQICVAEKGVFFYNLITCCYCLSHWVAIIILVLFPTRLFGISAPIDYFWTWLVISWVAGFQSLAMSRMWEKR